MTETEWVAATRPRAMLEFLQEKATDRKLRLFACACVRRVWAYLFTETGRTAVDVSERYADGLASRQEMTTKSLRTTGESHAEIAAGWAAREGHIEPILHAAWFAALASSPLVGPVEVEWRDRYNRPLDRPLPEDLQGHICDEEIEQCGVLRDIFRPFRPVAADSSWLTSTVVALAEGIYQDRAFDRLPILADALMDAGCHNEDVLRHCREPGEHVRGCWVVDLLTGRK